MEMSKSLKQAIIEYKTGDMESFRVLYDESSKYIYTCIYKVMSGNNNVLDIAEEIMQETYLEISQSINQLEDEEKFLSWAGTIANRKCFAYIKKNKKYVLLDEEDDTLDSLADSDSIIPEEVMQSKEKQRLLREIIDKELTEMQKICIIAYYYNEQKQSEIAKVLGIPENTVKTNLSRAKARIKDGVLDLEKNKGTRLYSVAPFLLMLFKEDVQAMVVPKEVTKATLTAVTMEAMGTSAAGGVTVGASSNVTSKIGIWGKIAGASLKTKIVGSIVGVGFAGIVSTVGIMNKTSEEATNAQATNAQQENSWEKVYSDIIMSERTKTFDLNDFEEDGIPELVVTTNDDMFIIYKYDGNLQTVTAGFNISTSVNDKMESYNNSTREHYVGYGISYNEIIDLMKLSYYKDGEILFQKTVPDYYIYEEGEFVTRVGLGVGYKADTGEVASYYLGEGNSKPLVSIEEGNNYIKQMEDRFREIPFVEPSEENIKIKFEEFKKNGNAEREPYLGEVIEYGRTQEENEIADEIKPEKEEPEMEEKVNLEEGEREVFTIFAQFMSATSWGEELTGQTITPNEQNMMDFIWRVANENGEWQGCTYEKYLPEIAQYTYGEECFTEEALKAYIKGVFGIQLDSINLDNAMGYLVENEMFMACEAQSESMDICEIREVYQKGDTYRVLGRNTFREWLDPDATEPEVWALYDFEMILEKSEESKLGYKFVQISYDVAENADTLRQSLVGNMLLHPGEHMKYFPEDVDFNDIWFALADYNGDGVEEVFVGDGCVWGDPDRIFNIIVESDGQVIDCDGQHIYKRVSDFELYVNGVMCSYDPAGANYGTIWNLRTGEQWDGSMMKLNEYDTLCVGDTIKLNWYKATEENIHLLQKNT